MCDTMLTVDDTTLKLYVDHDRPSFEKWVSEFKRLAYEADLKTDVFKSVISDQKDDDEILSLHEWMYAKQSMTPKEALTWNLNLIRERSISDEELFNLP